MNQRRDNESSERKQSELWQREKRLLKRNRRLLQLALFVLDRGFWWIVTSGGAPAPVYSQRWVQAGHWVQVCVWHIGEWPHSHTLPIGKTEHESARPCYSSTLEYREKADPSVAPLLCPPSAPPLSPPSAALILRQALNKPYALNYPSCKISNYQSENLQKWINMKVNKNKVWRAVGGPGIK